MTIASLLEPITGKPGAVRLEQAGNWMQGRTLYGGASALVALTMAKRAFPDLPPLRAAQVGFVAPVGENVELTAEIVRQGRNVTQIRSEIRSDGKVALTGFWLFAESRETNAERQADRPEDWPGLPTDNPVAMKGQGPAFIQNNFEVRFGQSKGEDHGATIRRWARLTEDHDLSCFVDLWHAGQPPVNDECLTILPDQDVARFQVTVQNASTVCVTDGLSDIDQSINQCPELNRVVVRTAWLSCCMELLDLGLEVIAVDQPHRVVRSAIDACPQTVDGDDSRMLEVAGNFRFDLKLHPIFDMVRLIQEDLFQCHSAAEFLIHRDADFAHAAFGTRERPENPKPLAAADVT